MSSDSQRAVSFKVWGLLSEAIEGTEDQSLEVWIPKRLDLLALACIRLQCLPPPPAQGHRVTNRQSGERVRSIHSGCKDEEQVVWDMMQGSYLGLRPRQGINILWKFCSLVSSLITASRLWELGFSGGNEKEWGLALSPCHPNDLRLPTLIHRKATVYEIACATGCLAQMKEEHRDLQPLQGHWPPLVRGGARTAGPIVRESDTCAKSPVHVTPLVLNICYCASLLSTWLISKSLFIFFITEILYPSTSSLHSPWPSAWQLPPYSLWNHLFCLFCFVLLFLVSKYKWFHKTFVFFSLAYFG